MPFAHRITKKHILPFISFALLSLSACSHSPNKSLQVLTVDSTDLAEYWVVKNSLIDWQTLFAKHRQDNPDSSPTLYKASFVIRSNGKVEQLKILNSVTGQYSDLAKDIDTQLLEFYPTVKNIAKQPVMLNTSFRI